MTEKDREAAEKLWTALARERAHLDAECTEDEVEQEAAWCQEAMSIVLDATAKKIRICTKSKRWWNADIKERRNAVGREKRKRNSGEAARAKAELQRSIQRSKSRMWSDYLQNLRGAEVWRAARYANPRAGATVEALTDKEGKQANTSLEKEEMLRHESFPRTTTTSTTSYLQQEAHIDASPSKQLSEPCILNQPRRHPGQTSCRLVPYGCSGSGTKRGL